MVPCPPNISTHLWSFDFSAWWALRRGSLIIDCVLNGVKNHILTALKRVLGYFSRRAGAVVGVDIRVADNHTPSNVASSGTIFSEGVIAGCG